MNGLVRACGVTVVALGLMLGAGARAAAPVVPGADQIVTRTLPNGLKLVYGASAGFDRAMQPGAFYIASFTETSKTAEAIDMTLATLARLHKDGLDAEQLKSSQSYILGQFPPTLETNGQIAGRLADMLFYGLGPEDVNEYATRVASVDAAVVRNTIDQSFPRTDNLALVVIGDAAKIRDAVRKFGPVTEMKLSDPRYTPVGK